MYGYTFKFHSNNPVKQVLLLFPFYYRNTAQVSNMTEP